MKVNESEYKRGLSQRVRVARKLNCGLFVSVCKKRYVPNNKIRVRKSVDKRRMVKEKPKDEVRPAP